MPKPWGRAERYQQSKNEFGVVILDTHWKGTALPSSLNPQFPLTCRDDYLTALTVQHFSSEQDPWCLLSALTWWCTCWTKTYYIGSKTTSGFYVRVFWNVMHLLKQDPMYNKMDNYSPYCQWEAICVTLSRSPSPKSTTKRLGSKILWGWQWLQSQVENYKGVPCWSIQLWLSACQTLNILCKC